MNDPVAPRQRKGLLFVDVDGTLVGPGGVHPRVWPAFDALRAAGWGIGLCTGRPGRGEALALAERADPDGLHVFESGAVVRHASGAVIASAELPADAIAAIVALGERGGATLETYTADGRYLATARNDHIVRHEALLAIPATIVPSVIGVSGVVRIQWVVPEAAWPALRAAAAAELGGVEVHEGRSPKMPDVVFVALVAHGISKAWGVARAAAHLGVPLADVAMVGDALNDVPVFRVVGTSFAAADGVPAAQAEAQHRVPGPSEGGVADAVQFLLARG